MQSRWVDRDAQATVDRYGRAGLSPDLALRIYSTRLLGGDRKLVLHGGGNTSMKTRMKDLVGDEVDVLCVKGTGSDMAGADDKSMVAVRLAPLQKLRTWNDLSDDEMARVQRAHLIDPMAPSPSLEVLLHAFVPHKSVDHTHATALLSLIDQPNGKDIAREVYGDTLGIVPYVRPGFGLAKAAANTFDANPKVRGLILDKHGIFTFGKDARESYECMIEMVTRAEERVAKGGKKPFKAAAVPAQIAPPDEVAPIVRGACSIRNETAEGAHRRMILEFRVSDAILNFVNGADVARFSARAS